MENLIQVLDARLAGYNFQERQRILHGVYKQTVPSNRGRQTKGPFRDHVESDGMWGAEFMHYLALQLDDHQLPNHARRTRQLAEYAPAIPIMDAYAEPLEKAVRAEEKLRFAGIDAPHLLLFPDGIDFFQSATSFVHNLAGMERGHPLKGRYDLTTLQRGLSLIVEGKAVVLEGVYNFANYVVGQLHPRTA